MMTTEPPNRTAEHIDRIETAEDSVEEKIADDLLLESGLLPLPDAAPSAGPAPAP
jgi:hypothetical protein